jgi:hypothetical protein
VTWGVSVDESPRELTGGPPKRSARGEPGFAHGRGPSGFGSTSTNLEGEPGGASLVGPTPRSRRGVAGPEAHGWPWKAEWRRPSGGGRMDRVEEAEWPDQGALGFFGEPGTTKPPKEPGGNPFRSPPQGTVIPGGDPPRTRVGR